MDKLFFAGILAIILKVCGMNGMHIFLCCVILFYGMCTSEACEKINELNAELKKLKDRI